MNNSPPLQVSLIADSSHLSAVWCITIIGHLSLEIIRCIAVSDVRKTFQHILVFQQTNLALECFTVYLCLDLDVLPSLMCIL